MDNNGFEDAILVRNQALSEVPNTKDKLPYESDEDFKIRQEILTDVPLPAGLANVEQPVNLEELFHELESLIWTRADECREIDELIQVLQEKKAKKEEAYNPKIQELENRIKAEVVKQEKPFKCDWGSATFRKGYDRTSWDSKKLAGLSLLIPEVNECKTVTKVEPSVSLKVGYQA